MTIYALTIWQPWASLIAIGAKPYEFRGWQPPKRFVGQRIAIHAGARPVRLGEVVDLLGRLDAAGDDCPCLHAALARPLLDRVAAGLRDRGAPLLGEGAPFRLPLSAIVCTAVLGPPKRGDECAAEFGGGSNDSDRDGTFNWGWPLRDIEPLMLPEPASGAQRFWQWRQNAP